MDSNNEVIQIPIEDLVPNRFQPRISFDEKALNDLANSIKQHGILQPLIVRRLGDKYEIIAGERRYKAAQIAGLISVPGLIANVNDESSAEIALVENVQRKDLSSIEEAKSYKNILDKSDMTQEELAKKMGLSQSSVANKLRLLNLNEDVQRALLENKISERHARSLLTVEDPATQSNLLHRVMDERLTVKQLDEEIKKLKNPVRDDEIDDVPLVDINGNLEQMQREATDISPLVNNQPNEARENQFLDIADSNSNERYDSVEVEPEVQNVPTPPIGSDYFNFGTNPEAYEPVQNNEINNDTPTESMVEEVFNTPSEEIETLDFEPGVAIFETEKPKSGGLPSIINTIRDKVNELNVNNNIKIEEIDTEGSYKINIEIQKDS